MTPTPFAMPPPSMQVDLILAEALTPESFRRWLLRCQQGAWSPRNWWTWYETYLEEHLAAIGFASRFCVITVNDYTRQVAARSTKATIVTGGAQQQPFLHQRIAADWVQVQVQFLHAWFDGTQQVVGIAISTDIANTYSVEFMLDRLDRAVQFLRKEHANDL